MFHFFPPFFQYCSVKPTTAPQMSQKTSWAERQLQKQEEEKKAQRAPIMVVKASDIPKPVVYPRALSENEAYNLQAVGFTEDSAEYPLASLKIFKSGPNSKTPGREYVGRHKDGKPEWLCHLDEPHLPWANTKKEDVLLALTQRVTALEQTVQSLVDSYNEAL